MNSTESTPAKAAIRRLTLQNAVWLAEQQTLRPDKKPENRNSKHEFRNNIK
jgi:hypothetical protein